MRKFEVMKTNDPPEYFSYLLRLWRENGKDGMSWRVSLESTETGDRLGFANLDLMFEYIKGQTKLRYKEKGAPNDDTQFRI